MKSRTSANVSDLASRLQSADDPTRQQAQEELRALIAIDVRRIRRMQMEIAGDAIAMSLFLLRSLCIR